MNISHIPFSFFLFVVACLAELILGNLRERGEICRKNISECVRNLKEMEKWGIL